MNNRSKDCLLDKSRPVNNLIAIISLTIDKIALLIYVEIKKEVIRLKKNQKEKSEENKKKTLGKFSSGEQVEISGNNPSINELYKAKKHSKTLVFQFKGNVKSPDFTIIQIIEKKSGVSLEVMDERGSRYKISSYKENKSSKAKGHLIKI
jgi:hypothetical protein